MDKFPADHNEYFYGKKSQAPISPVSEVLQHDFKIESTKDLKHDYAALKEEKEKIQIVRQKLQNITEIDKTITINSLPDEDAIVANESESVIDAKLKEVSEELEQRNKGSLLYKLFHWRA